MTGRAGSSRPIRLLLGDERGIIVGFFVRLAIFLALLGLTAVETGAVIWARFQARDAADSAAIEGAATYRDTGNMQSALLAVEDFIERRDSEMTVVRKRFLIEPDGTVRVTVRKEASTVLVQHIGFLKGFHLATGTGQADPPSF